MYEERKPGHFVQEIGGIVTFGRIIDEEGRVLGDDQLGIIQTKASEVDSDVFAIAESGSGFVSDDGYVTTRQIGIVDSDGFLTVMGTKKKEGESIARGR